jgi:aldehyde dehydrogenase (NAD+)
MTSPPSASKPATHAARARELCERLGLRAADLCGDLAVRSPIDGSEIASVTCAGAAELEQAIAAAATSFQALRIIPAPRRGEVIRLFGQALREHKQDLGALVSLESGKILQEAFGEVQEMIDICDFAVGLSRQLYGLTIASERPGHRMLETWHPLGPVAVISAFNFPVAVWAWNFALAIVCGDPVIWKPSEKTPITALACQRIFASVIRDQRGFPPDISQVLIGGAELGMGLARDPRVSLLSATGSCEMGRAVAPIVAARLGRCLLELGGNNAMIVGPSADLDLAARAILFSAVGTAGQRCTSLRRLFVHEDIYTQLVPRLATTYAQVPIGSPMEATTLVGPLIDAASFERMQRALAQAKAEGGRISGGERVLQERYPNAYYAQPAIAEMPEQTPIVLQETFAPILYAMRYRELDQAITLHNAAEQGLASCIFTSDLREAERFLSPTGSDCGIANVNIGPSGAEIGGAFGGEKATGGGREAGSDAWKNYMRRATSTINYSNDLPLAQGIEFG